MLIFLYTCWNSPLSWTHVPSAEWPDRECERDIASVRM